MWGRAWWIYSGEIPNQDSYTSAGPQYSRGASSIRRRHHLCRSTFLQFIDSFSKNLAVVVNGLDTESAFGVIKLSITSSIGVTMCIGMASLEFDLSQAGLVVTHR
jgi:hypothetical protein